MTQALPRSYLYVPAHRPELIAKARASSADALVIDLEDAVPAAQKAAAREALREALRSSFRQQVWVRINAVSAGMTAEDVAAAAGEHLTGLRIAKVQSPEEVRFVADALAAAGGDAAIQCLIESALGLERIGEITRAHQSVRGILLGEADLGADLGTRTDEGLLYARSRCVAAARAAGLAPPVQSVFTNVHDDAGLRRSTEAGLALGFFGRSAIHPRQLDIINEACTPSAELVREARELIERLEQEVADGASAFTLPDGRFVDPAVVESARRTLALAARVEPASARSLA